MYSWVCNLKSLPCASINRYFYTCINNYHIIYIMKYLYEIDDNHLYTLYTKKLTINQRYPNYAKTVHNIIQYGIHCAQSHMHRYCMHDKLQDSVHQTAMLQTSIMKHKTKQKIYHIKCIFPWIWPVHSHWNRIIQIRFQ